MSLNLTLIRSYGSSFLLTGKMTSTMKQLKWPALKNIFMSVIELIKAQWHINYWWIITVIELNKAQWHINYWWFITVIKLIKPSDTSIIDVSLGFDQFNDWKCANKGIDKTNISHIMVKNKMIIYPYSLHCGSPISWVPMSQSNSFAGDYLRYYLFARIRFQCMHCSSN